MTTTSTGQTAESAVAKHLKDQRYVILEQNWRTRWCEIDVIAKKDNMVCFVEVKYRQSDRQGDGLAYITDKKLRQMSFAAEFWVARHRWDGEYCLAAASVNGTDFEVGQFILL